MKLTKLKLYQIFSGNAMGIFYCISICLFYHNSTATHIVGGDLSVKQLHADDNQYEINLTFLFDQVNGDPLAEVAHFPVGIFRQSDHHLLEYFLVYADRYPHPFIQYSDSNCAVGQLKSRIIKYSRVRRFDKELYQEPVYLVVENCCRNNILSNIFDSGNASIVFYTSLPGLWEGSKIKAESSPMFTDLVGDYGCVGRELELDFKCEDSDGDSLVYDIVSPLKGHTGPFKRILPLSSDLPSGPFSPIDMVLGFDSTHISQNGYIKVNENTGKVKVLSTQQGLFAFTVRCNEFRFGKKIGEVRRDYQLMVLPCAPISVPNISLVHGTVRYVDSTDILEIKSLKEWETIIVKDSNKKVDIGFYPLNFLRTQIDYKITTGYVAKDDSLRSYFKWADCLTPESNIIYKMHVIATNNSCPQSKRDTILVKFRVILPVNVKPLTRFTTLFPKGLLYPKDEEVINISTIHSDSSEIPLDNIFQYITINGDSVLANWGLVLDRKVSSSSIHSTLPLGSVCNWLKKAGEVEIRILSVEQYCQRQFSDTISFKYVFKDNDYSSDSLRLINVFTPNGDGLNDVFLLKGMPPDRCGDFFLEAKIFNRWGVLKYHSKEKAIIWDGANADEGIYYFESIYEKSQFKGWLELRK